VSTPTQPGEPLGRLGTTLLGLYLFLTPVAIFWVLLVVFPDMNPAFRLTTAPLTPAASPADAPAGAPAAQSPATGTLAEYQRIPRFQPVGLLPCPWCQEKKRWLYIHPNDDQGLILLAILAGALGSFIHACQSFTAYVGNREALRSWVWWYLLRPSVGSALGLIFYFVFRAGLLGTGDTTAVSPYGVVALAGMAGWFSKQATEKLKEVFDTLFKSVQFKDQLKGTAARVTSIDPSPVPAGNTEVELTIHGEGFVNGATVRIGTRSLKATFVDASTLRAVLPAADRPAAGSTEDVTVSNPPPADTPSDPFRLKFE
jgi:hypothetical protein